MPSSKTLVKIAVIAVWPRGRLCRAVTTRWSRHHSTCCHSKVPSCFFQGRSTVRGQLLCFLRLHAAPLALSWGCIVASSRRDCSVPDSPRTQGREGYTLALTVGLTVYRFIAFVHRSGHRCPNILPWLLAPVGCHRNDGSRTT